MISITGQSAPSVGPKLLALATEKSPEKRLELLRDITDGFAVADRERSSVQYMLDEIVSALVEKIGDRARASSILAQMERLPDGMADRLARDRDFAVARSIIRDYRGLSRSTLLDLASNGTQHHLEAIAGRNALDPEICDIVIDRGGSHVVRTLASNQGARFSRFGLRRMIHKAEDDDELKETLVERSDLTLEAIGQLLPIVSERLAHRMRSPDLTFQSTVMQDHLVGWISDRKKNVAQVTRSIENIRAGSQKLDSVLLELAVQRRLLDVATVVAAVSDLDREYGFNLVVQGRTDSVVVLLKSLACEWKAAEAVLKLRIDKLGTQLCGAMVDQAAYDDIDRAGAQRVIRFLRVRRSAMAQANSAA